MEFNFDDYEELSEEKLIERLRYNARTAVMKKAELESIRSATSSSAIEVVQPSNVVLLDEETKKTKEKASDFEKEVEYYLSEFKKLEGVYTEENLDRVLPSPNAENHNEIIMRILVELGKDIKDIDEILMAESDSMSIEELQEFKTEINNINITRSLLKKRIMTSGIVPPENNKHNKLVFVPMSTGKIRVFDEIKDIPEEDYELFIELFDSIKDGTFKNVRRFVIHSKVIGTLEVKSGQARVVYNRISNDSYAIISVFIKQSTNDKAYRVAVHNKIFEYKAIEDELKEKLKDPEFVKKQEDTEHEIYKLFSKKSTDNKGGAK